MLPNGVIEVGNVMFSPELQRTPAATEAMYLMARHAFEDLGYRRYECEVQRAESAFAPRGYALGSSLKEFSVST